ncbi:hypothetical protein ACF07U_18840 [Streptomyces californicus]|uniref:hypothetical protein n=1 Tax=Streptomyces californicus TaxID=67351 RepID=UPI0036F95F9C
MNVLTSLTRICPPPAAEGRSLAEHIGEGGMVVPQSHTAMLDVYGPGCFNDFLWIYDRARADVWPDIGARSRESAEILAGKEIPAIRSVTGRLGAAPEDLIQWGGTDNADSLFWIPVGEPESWPTLLVEAGHLAFLLVEEPSPSVILGLLAGTLECPFFPPDFREAEPSFERWRGEGREEP